MQKATEICETEKRSISRSLEAASENFEIDQKSPAVGNYEVKAAEISNEVLEEKNPESPAEPEPTISVTTAQYPQQIFASENFNWKDKGPALFKPPRHLLSARVNKRALEIS